MRAGALAGAAAAALALVLGCGGEDAPLPDPVTRGAPLAAPSTGSTATTGIDPFDPHATAPLRARAGAWLRVNFAELDRLAGPDGASPAAQELDHEAVELVGRMTILVSDDGRVGQFLLSRHAPGCCFGRAVRPGEWVVCDAEPAVAPTAEAMIRVRGTIAVGTVEVAGGIFSAVYRLRATEVDRVG